MPTTTAEEQPAPPGQDAHAAGFRRVLKNRNFLLLWLAQLISLTVLNAANFGIIVLVNDITHSVVMVGLAIIAFTLPALPFSALAGVVVDRINKRLVLWVSNVLRLLTMLLVVISLLHNRNDLLPLYILIFMTAVIGQFFTPAEGASIPLLVGEAELVPALSLFNITTTLSQAIGFLLLGSIVTSLFPPFTLQIAALSLHIESIDMLFVLAAFLYLVCALLILLIPTAAFAERHLEEQSNDQTGLTRLAVRRVWHEIVEGWRYVRGDRQLYFAVIQLSVVGNIMLLIGELAGAFVQQVLHQPADRMALVLTPAAVGLVGASIVMPRITARMDKVRLTWIGFVGLAAGFVLLPVSQTVAAYFLGERAAGSIQLLLVTLFLMLALGVAMASVNIPTQALMQERSPEEVRGRVFSLQFMLYNTGSIPILLFAGFFAQYIGFDWLILLLSLSLLLFCLWGVWYLKRDRRPVPT
jgi:MFS family permease